MKIRQLMMAPTVLALMASGAVFAQSLQVDWLYFSGNGSWITRTESLTGTENNLHLPVNDLTAEQFWWQSSNASTQVVWAQPDPLGLPKKGVPVEIKGESGL